MARRDVRWAKFEFGSDRILTSQSDVRELWSIAKKIFSAKKKESTRNIQDISILGCSMIY
jgi:hypothetical protein